VASILGSPTIHYIFDEAGHLLSEQNGYADENKGPGQFGDDESEDYVVSHYENPVRADYGLPTI